MTTLATLLCFLCIAYLFWVDRKQAEAVSAAAWIPLLWMFFAGSRYASQWLDLGPPSYLSAEELDEGSPLNRNVFLFLVIAGMAVLGQRKVNWSAVLTQNSWLLLFFLFAATSTLWADDTFLSLKRWVKGVGTVVMALIILTEERPYQALGFVLRRLAYVLLPLSVLFIKYYPELGRSYDQTGAPMFTGVTFQKNSLGQICLLVGVYFCWELLFRRFKPLSSEGRIPLSVGLIILPLLLWLLYASQGEASRAGLLGAAAVALLLVAVYLGWERVSGPLQPVSSEERIPLSVGLIIVPMLLWLLHVSQSATSRAALFGAVAFLLAARLPFFSRRPPRLIVVGLLVVAVIGFLEYALGIKEWAIRLLGRRPDLTERTFMWDMLLQMVPNTWVGAGYESFWSGDRLKVIWARMGESSRFIQAHNGYIETYLNLGIVGVILLVIAILAGLRKAQKRLEHEYAYAVLKIALILVAIAYNYTEAAFKPLHNVFVLLLVAILQVPRVRVSGRTAAGEIQASTLANAMTRTGRSRPLGK